MTTPRRLITIWLAFRVVAAAADPTLINLVMPDAKFVMGVNAAKILASPIAREIAAQVRGGNPEVQKVLADIGFDPTRDLQEIVLATTGQGQNPPTLLMARGNFDVAKFSSFVSNGKTPLTYEGVTILKSSGTTYGAVAFLDNTVALGGDLDQVRAAIHRHMQGTALNSTLSAKVDGISRRYDVWLVSSASMSGVASSITDPNMRQMGQLLESIQEVSGGIKFGPGMEMAVEALTRTAKDASGLADSVRLLVALASMNQQGGSALRPDSLKLTVDARTVRLTLNITEEEMRKAYQAQMARRTTQQPAQEKPHVAATGLTIQSSDKDMGTVSLPPAKKE